jgi:hypothetical protein
MIGSSCNETNCPGWVSAVAAAVVIYGYFILDF